MPQQRLYTNRLYRATGSDGLFASELAPLGLAMFPRDNIVHVHFVIGGFGTLGLLLVQDEKFMGKFK